MQQHKDEIIKEITKLRKDLAAKDT